jgi:hypothetical protein
VALAHDAAELARREQRPQRGELRLGPVLEPLQSIGSPAPPRTGASNVPVIGMAAM